MAPDTPQQSSRAEAVKISTAKWFDIKDDNFKERSHFLAGLKLLEAKVDGQIAELIGQA